VGGSDMAVEAGALGKGAAAGGTPVQLQVLVHRPAGRRRRFQMKKFRRKITEKYR
jgi:hypothetical protein